MNYTKKFPAQFASYDEFEAKLIENNAECAYQYTKNGIESELKFSTQMFGSDGTWYGDGRGGTQSELITELYDANDATSVKIWFKADADVSPHNIAHTAALVLGNVEFYGNGADFNGTEFSIDTTSGETTFNQKAQSFSAFDCRNIKFWGANTKGFDIKISVDNCENTSEMYFMSFPIGQIATAKLDVTVKNSSFGTEGTIYQPSSLGGAIDVQFFGSLVIENCKWYGCPTVVKFKNKKNAIADISIKDCLIVDSGLNENDYSGTSFLISTSDDDNAVIKATIQGCEFKYTDTTPINGEIVFGEPRASKTFTGTITGTIAECSDARVAIAKGSNGITTTTVKNGDVISYTFDKNTIIDPEHFQPVTKVDFLDKGKTLKSASLNDNIIVGNDITSGLQDIKNACSKTILNIGALEQIQSVGNAIFEKTADYRSKTNPQIDDVNKVLNLLITEIKNIGNYIIIK